MCEAYRSLNSQLYDFPETIEKNLGMVYMEMLCSQVSTEHVMLANIPHRGRRSADR